MPGTALMASSSASISARMVPNRRASRTATVLPTWRMPRPNRRLESGRARLASMAAHQLLGRLLREAIQLDQAVGRELVQVGDVAYETGVEQLAHPLVAQAADVHRVARREVHDALEDPSRARDVGAVAHHLVRRPLDRACRSAGHWSGIRHGFDRVSGSTPSSTGPDHLRDDLARHG